MDDRRALSRNLDRPIATPVTDLKCRGLLDETLVVGSRVFVHTSWQGLTPRGRGRGHSRGFTCDQAAATWKAVSATEW